MKAALYVRVSTEEQATQGFSISAQINQLTEYCDKNDIGIYKVYSDEGITGQIEARPEFQKMIQDAPKKLFDIILVHKFDRFARKVELSQRLKTQLRKSGVNVVSMTEPIENSPIGFFQEGILELLAEYYVRNLSAEVKKGQGEKIRQGFAVNMMPYGYKNISGKVEIVEDQANIVKNIYEMYNSGTGTVHIANYLNNNDIPTMKPGGSWNSSQINYILNNETYTGSLKWAGEIYKNSFDAIIPEDYFIKTQNIIGSKKQKTAYRNKHYNNYLLLGLAKCGICNNPMRISKMVSFGGKGSKTYYMYTCRRARYKKDDCTHSKLYQHDKLEQHILDELRKILVSTDIAINVVDTKINEITTFVKNKKLKLQNELERSKRAYLSNVFSLEEYAEIKTRLEKELSEIQSDENINEEERQKENAKQIKIKIMNTWDKLNSTEDVQIKKALLQEFIQSIFITPEKIDMYFYQ
jgi:DNA invertase Pin-like site-specific DNA recombinase